MKTKEELEAEAKQAEEFEKARAQAHVEELAAATERAKREHEETQDRIRLMNQVAAEAELRRLVATHPAVAALVKERDELKAKLAELTAGDEDDTNANPDTGTDTGGKRRSQKSRA